MTTITIERTILDRLIEAWDSTVLPTHRDGMMQERMEDLRAELAKPPTPAWRDAPETIALQLELASAKESYLNACKLVADMHAAAVGEVTGPRPGVVEDVIALKAERDSAMKDANRVDWYEQNKNTVLHIGKRWYSRVGYGAPIRRQNSFRDAVDAAIAKAEGDAIKKGG